MTLSSRRGFGLLLFAAGIGFGGVSALGVQSLKGTTPVTPVVLSGDQIGFRMQARRGDTPVGSVVVMVDGEWKDVEFGYMVKRQP